MNGDQKQISKGALMKQKKMTFDIPYIRLRFYAEMLADTRLPASKVSALRGGMGEMLLRQNCVNGRKCDGCMFHQACPVYRTLYTPMDPKPRYVTGQESVGYLLECSDRSEFMEKGDRLVFHLVLFGESIVYFNLYLQAFALLGMSGLGSARTQFRIAEVRNTEGGKIVSGNHVDMGKYRYSLVSDYIKRRKAELGFCDGKYRLTFTAPLAMKYQKEYMNRFYAEALVKGAARRVQMLNYYIGNDADLPEFSRYPVIRSQTVRKESVKRYSHTQGGPVTLRGISGQVFFQDMPEECLNYLIAGELTHMGKCSSFGFGKYYLEQDRFYLQEK